MANYETILCQKQRHGVLITLNRPNALNAMNQDLLSELDQALAEAEADPEIRAVVLTGAGKGFCSGADLVEMQTHLGQGGQGDIGEYLRNGLNRIAIAMRQLEKPIICALNGVAAGAGVGSWATTGWASQIRIKLKKRGVRYRRWQFFRLVIMLSLHKNLDFVKWAVTFWRWNGKPKYDQTVIWRFAFSTDCDIVTACQMEPL